MECFFSLVEKLADSKSDLGVCEIVQESVGLSEEPAVADRVLFGLFAGPMRFTGFLAAVHRSGFQLTVVSGCCRSQGDRDERDIEFPAGKEEQVQGESSVRGHGAHVRVEFCGVFGDDLLSGIRH